MFTVHVEETRRSVNQCSDACCHIFLIVFCLPFNRLPEFSLLLQVRNEFLSVHVCVFKKVSSRPMVFTLQDSTGLVVVSANHAVVPKVFTN